MGKNGFMYVRPVFQACGDTFSSQQPGVTLANSIILRNLLKSDYLREMIL